ncbi:MAG: helix-turn-helix domain-containing protein [Thermoplasmata archaeon]
MILATPRQFDVLRAIAATVERAGFPPSLREIGDQVGLSSTSTIHEHMQALVRKGYLRHEPGKMRALALTEQGWAWYRTEAEGGGGMAGRTFEIQYACRQCGTRYEVLWRAGGPEAASVCPKCGSPLRKWLAHLEQRASPAAKQIVAALIGEPEP